MMRRTCFRFGRLLLGAEVAKAVGISPLLLASIQRAAVSRETWTSSSTGAVSRETERAEAKHGL